MSLLNNGRYNMVDGRTRLWMYDQMFDKAEVQALIIVDGLKNEAQLISLAFLLNNPEGPQPPDKGDVEHTVEELLKRKVPKKDIPSLLGLPDMAVKKFINDVETRFEHAKTLRAFKHVVNSGMSVSEAAEAEGTTPEKVRNYIAAGRRKRKASDLESASRNISGSFKSLSSTIHMTMRVLTGKYEDGDVTAKDVFDVFKKIEGYQTRNSKAVKALRERFEGKANGNGK